MTRSRREMTCVEVKLRNPIYAEPTAEYHCTSTDNPGALLICWWWDVSREIATRYALSASIPPGPFSTSHPRPHPHRIQSYRREPASAFPPKNPPRFLPRSFVPNNNGTRDREREIGKGFFSECVKKFWKWIDESKIFEKRDDENLSFF